MHNYFIDDGESSNKKNYILGVIHEKNIAVKVLLSSSYEMCEIPDVCQKFIIIIMSNPSKFILLTQLSLIAKTCKFLMFKMVQGQEPCNNKLQIRTIAHSLHT